MNDYLKGRECIGSYSLTEIPPFVKVGNYCSISKDVIFHSFDTNHLCIANKECVFTTNWQQPQGLGQITINSDVWIGEGVRILPNVEIGTGAIIGAGAVIAKDVLPFSVVVGNPQVIVRYRFKPEIIDKLYKIKWWDWPQDLVEQRIEDLKSVNGFVEKYYEG